MFSRVAVINVPSKVGKEAWEKCYRLAFQQSYLVGINESFLKINKDTYRQMMKEYGHKQYGLRAGPNPIFWDPTLYRARTKKHVRLHVRGSSALAKRFPGFNDARYATAVLFQKKADNGGHRFGVINTHWVPEGRRVTNAWRAWARRESKKGVKKLAKPWIQKGYPVWFIGDTNIKKSFRMRIRGAKFHWIRGEGIDKIGIWIPNKKTSRAMKFTDSNWNRFKAPTDHHYGYVATAFYE